MMITCFFEHKMHANKICTKTFFKCKSHAHLCSCLRFKNKEEKKGNLKEKEDKIN